MFSDWSKTSHMLWVKLTTSLGKQQHNFQLAHDQVMLLETAASLWASQRKANDFFTVYYSFELGSITKHLMTGPTGTVSFVSPQP